jgi:hypothetical protein
MNISVFIDVFRASWAEVMSVVARAFPAPAGEQVVIRNFPKITALIGFDLISLFVSKEPVLCSACNHF